MCQVFAQKLGVLVAAVSYRRAPEHPFPAALHDCHDGLEWLAKRGDVDATRIAIGGASAGGGLAAALALLARERGAVMPRFQLLSYPMLDDRTVLAHRRRRAVLPAVERRGEPVRLDFVSRPRARCPWRQPSGRTRPRGEPVRPPARMDRRRHP